MTVAESGSQTGDVMAGTWVSVSAAVTAAHSGTLTENLLAEKLA